MEYEKFKLSYKIILDLQQHTNKDYNIISKGLQKGTIDLNYDLFDIDKLSKIEYICLENDIFKFRYKKIFLDFYFFKVDWIFWEELNIPFEMMFEFNIKQG